MTTRIHAPPNSPARRRFVGASEVPAIRGASPYASAYSVWAGKVLDSTEPVDSLPIRIGNALESVILDAAADALGVAITKPELAYVVGHLGANLDGLTADGRVVEAKAWSARDVDDAESVGLDLDDVAPGKALCVWWQMQAQMLCAGATRGVLAALCDKRLVLAHVDADPAAQAVIIADVEGFWSQYVETRIAPPADVADVELLRRTPIGDAELTDDTLADVLAAHAAAKRRVADAEREAGTLEAQIRQRLGDAKSIAAAGWRVSRSRVETSRLDAKRLQADHPALCAGYIATGGYDRLSIREPK